jgi:pyruvate dehydrogenase E1 component
VLRAQEILAERYGVGSDVWSVTSYKELRRDALEVERYNRLHPDEKPKQSYLEQAVGDTPGPFVAASDYMKLVSEQIARWLPGTFTVLGTDGFGRSDTRVALRRHFEVDAEHIAFATLATLAREGTIENSLVSKAIGDLGVDPAKVDPILA